MFVLLMIIWKCDGSLVSALGSFIYIVMSKPIVPFIVSKATSQHPAPLVSNLPRDYSDHCSELIELWPLATQNKNSIPP